MPTTAFRGHRHHPTAIPKVRCPECETQVSLYAGRLLAPHSAWEEYDPYAYGYDEER